MTPPARGRAPALVDGVLYLGDEEPGPFGLDLGVPVGQHLGEVVAGVDVEDGEGDPPGLEGLGGEMEQDAESLPPLKRRTGRSDSAATSRMMKMARDSSRSRWPRGCSTGLTRAVTDAPA